MFAVNWSWAVEVARLLRADPPRPRHLKGQLSADLL
jgi:hypothetical protein